MLIKTDIFGDEQVSHELDKILLALGGESLERILVAGALIPTNRAKAICPKRTGNLARSIHIGGHTPGSVEGGDIGGNGHSATGAWIQVGTNVEYADAVENGSAAHVIVPRNAKALFWPGAAHPVPKVQHPGTPAKPFMRPAFDGAGPEMAAEMSAAARVMLGSM